MPKQTSTSIRPWRQLEKGEPAATVTQPDNIPAILRAMRTGGTEELKLPVKAVAAVCGQLGSSGPSTAEEPELRYTGPDARAAGIRDPLGLQADITAQQQQRERGRERRAGSAKREKRLTPAGR